MIILSALSPVGFMIPSTSVFAYNWLNTDKPSFQNIAAFTSTKTFLIRSVVQNLCHIFHCNAAKFTLVITIIY